MAKVTLENVTKVHGDDVVALKEMNLDIPDGEFEVFVGRSLLSSCGTQGDFFPTVAKTWRLYTTFY